MLSRHRKPTRTRYVVLAVATAGLLGVTGVASARTIHRSHDARPASALGSATTEAYRHRPRPTTSATTAPTTPATSAPTTQPTAPPPTVPASPSATPSATTPDTTPTTVPTTAPATTPTTVPPTTTPAGDPVITAALEHINAARAANGVAPLTLSAQLSTASEAHNALMAGGCGLSHQCSGEAGLGDRFTAAGVSWNTAGENIGQGNAQNTQASIIAAANGLTDLMMAEVAPNDGHRKNLLNTSFKRIGLAVTRDSNGKVWFTQDFVN
ncbi:CAP domain-containing protein [Actinoplanes sp. NPDC026619]|uniref:CAP domain-containing protein n=1 Tax=Actinoplanes sp. NPDC026619 TaxID=3155798 RepID=UPI0033CCCC97